jgi:hypothetical protein
VKEQQPLNLEKTLRLRKLAAGLTLSIAVGAGAIGAIAAATPASASTTNPAANITPPQPLCGDLSAACIATDLADIDAARAQEGVGPMSLPSDFATLSGPEQELVVTNAERTDRGLPAFPGLDPDLDSAAQAAADSDNDPTPPAGYPWDSYGSIWAETPSILYADYLWMYSDGPDGTNVDCTSPGAQGCWGHRENILGNYSYTNGDTPAIGAAVSGSSWAEIFVSNTAGGPTGITDPYSNVAPNTTQTTPTTPTPAPTPTPAADTTGDQASGISSAYVNGGTGYYIVSPSGKVTAFGGATFHGDLSDTTLNAPIIAITATADGGGYWLLAADGGVFSFGDAGFYGSTGNMTLKAPVVAMATTPDGHGYWIIAADGGVFNFGDAGFHGSTGGMTLNQPIDGIAIGPDGNGYWLVASDGGVFAFNEPFVGSLGGTTLNAPIIGMTNNNSGNGYTLVASDGGVFNYNTPYYGSLGANPPATPIVALSTTPDNGGYYLVDSGGDVFTFGDAINYGGL